MIRRRFFCRAFGLAFLAASSTIAFAQGIQERTIKLGYLVPPDHPYAQGLHKFVELVAAKSGGKLKVKEFPGASLGTEQQQQGALQGGVQEMLAAGTVSLAPILKDTGLLDTLYAIERPEQADALMDGPFGQALWAKLPEKGMVAIGNFEGGFRAVTNSKRPVTTAEDLKGLKIRVPPNPVYVDAFKAMGANPAALSFAELYPALDSKTVDGQENPLPQILSSKFYEVQKYASLTNHAYTLVVVLVSKKFWDKLSPPEQEILRTAGAEASVYQRKVARDAEKRARAELQSKGMQINDLPPAELAKLRDLVKPINERFAAQYDPALVKLFNSELQRIKTSR
jgi:tripartite ATP-independent transporter DctP family solute receptor